jgi:alkylation response protein AidB-like acyl-CoA dehydrogenase
MMDVRISPEQQAVRDSVAQVVDRLGPTAVGQLGDAERAAKLDAAVVASGWRELRVAEADGSPLASAVEVAIVAEELARGLADTPFLGPTLAAELRRVAGAPGATDVETVALTPELGALGSSVAIDAHGAEGALVLVGEGQVGRAPLGKPGEPLDLTRPSAPVGEAEAVADLGDVTAWTAFGLAVTSAELVGTMRGAVDLAVGYATERVQYGTAIGSFQAVQHLLADAFTLMEGSRSITLHAAWAVDALPPEEALAAAAAAKAYCARAARTVCETAIQVHGGIGNTWECLAHLHLRRALLSSDVLGGVGPNLDRVLEHRGLR